jgi:hypothetical protein
MHPSAIHSENLKIRASKHKIKVVHTDCLKWNYRRRGCNRCRKNSNQVESFAVSMTMHLVLELRRMLSSSLMGY